MASYHADQIPDLKEPPSRPHNLRRPSPFKGLSYSSKIFVPVEPDLGDQRQSTYKALPSRPTTVKVVMNRFRFSAVFAFACAVVSFALTLVFVLAGRNPGTLEEQYMIRLNASNVGQNIVRFERATSTSAAPSATSSSSSSNPLEPLNPLSTANPLNPNNPNNPLSGLTGILDPLLGNITDSINNGTQDAINEVVKTLVDTSGVRDQYLLYLEKICEGDAKIDKCSSYDDAQTGLNAIVNNVHSSVVIGTTNVSVPLIAQLSHSLNTLSSGISGFRKAMFAFLIISLIGSGLTALTSLPAVFFPQSRLLIYASLGWAALSSSFAFLAAIILTALIEGIVGIADGFGDAVSLYIKEGNHALLFIWLGWMFIFLATVYWFAVWFVEVRTWAFSKRERTEEQRGNWRGTPKEVWTDLRGRKDL